MEPLDPRARVVTMSPPAEPIAAATLATSVPPLPPLPPPPQLPVSRFTDLERTVQVAVSDGVPAQMVTRATGRAATVFDEGAIHRTAP